jgi:hypothetical protein
MRAMDSRYWAHCGDGGLDKVEINAAFPTRSGMRRGWLASSICGVEPAKQHSQPPGHGGSKPTDSAAGCPFETLASRADQDSETPSGPLHAGTPTCNDFTITFDVLALGQRQWPPPCAHRIELVIIVVFWKNKDGQRRPRQRPL